MRLAGDGFIAATRFTGGGTTIRLGFAILMLPFLADCGPMFSPMSPRLTPKDQRTVDQLWNNMLTPVQRVDRQTLLDANVAFWMYTFGIDRLRMTSEKYFNGGTAMMEIDCDRANPDADEFTITILDKAGRTLRRSDTHGQKLRRAPECCLECPTSTQSAFKGKSISRSASRRPDLPLNRRRNQPPHSPKRLRNGRFGWNPLAGGPPQPPRRNRLGNTTLVLSCLCGATQSRPNNPRL